MEIRPVSQIGQQQGLKILTSHKVSKVTSALFVYWDVAISAAVVGLTTAIIVAASDVAAFVHAAQCVIYRDVFEL